MNWNLWSKLIIMHYNFIKKTKFQEMTSISGGISMYTWLMPVKPNNIIKKTLKYTNSITDISSLTWYGVYSINNPYKNYLDALYPNLFLWDNFSSMAIATINVGDGISFNSTFFNYNNSSATATISDFLTTSANETYPNYYQKVGYLRSTDNVHKGYVLYDHGVYILFDDAASALSLWNSTSGDSFTYSVFLGQNELKFYCDIDGMRIKSSNNLSYWDSINETDSITSSLTSHWSQSRLSNLSISSDAKDWMIIQPNDKPLFITGIGFYNEKNECLAVAKIKEPFKLIDDFDMTFVVSLKF